MKKINEEKENEVKERRMRIEEKRSKRGIEIGK